MAEYESGFPDHRESYGISPQELKRLQVDDLNRAATIHAYEESINRPVEERWVKSEGRKANCFISTRKHWKSSCRHRRTNCNDRTRALMELCARTGRGIKRARGRCELRCMER